MLNEMKVDTSHGHVSFVHCNPFSYLENFIPGDIIIINTHARLQVPLFDRAPAPGAHGTRRT